MKIKERKENIKETKKRLAKSLFFM